MADEKTMKPINESESKQDRPKRRYHRRSNKAAKPSAEETPAASGEELVSTPKPSRSRKKTLDEAIAAVDIYLADATLAGLNEVSIIHGKGTGVLRTGIQRHLRTHMNVKKYRDGMYGEGEQGVTVVTLK